MSKGEAEKRAHFLQRSVPGSVVAAVVGGLLLLFVVAPQIWYGNTHSRRAAQKSSCQFNIKECGRAILLYADDYGSLPSSAIASGSPEWNKRDFLNFATHLGSIRSDDQTKAAAWAQCASRFMSDPSEYVFTCPAEESRMHKSVLSFYWRAAVDKAWYGMDCAEPCESLDNYCKHSEQIMLYESNSWHREEPAGLKNESPINVVYFDGHVKWVTLRNTTSGNLNKCAANSDGEPMYFNFDTKTNTPLPPNTPAKYVDPGRYIDKFN